MNARFVIDMDNTLYPSQFAQMCYKMYGKPDNPGIELLKWDWHKDYGLTDKQFYAAVDKVHATQRDYKPFPGAIEALEEWHSQGYHITIATHRQTYARNFRALVDWLSDYKVPYDALYMGPGGKEALFGGDTIVIDDMPKTITAAVQAYCPLVVTLAHPYVKATVDDYFPYAHMGETWRELRNIVNKYLINKEAGAL
jgi:beta-phosphoglucomutase-like phosphatase (HAD superfamily)